MYVLNYTKTYEDLVQVLENKPNSWLIRTKMSDIIDMLLKGEYYRKLLLQKCKSLNDLHKDTKIRYNEMRM